MDEKNLKIARYITGVLFLALAITSFLYKYTYSDFASTYAIGYIVSAFGAAIMAVSMFLGMRQVFMVGAGVQAVSCLIKLLALHKNIMNILSAVLLLAGYVLAAFAIQDKKNTSKYAIVSVVLFLIGNIANQIAFLTDKLSIIWALKDFVSAASPVLLACIVMENVPQVQTTKMVKESPQIAKSDNRIEELTKLKDLLDVGAITQEEFDAKKKQLLNL